MNKLVVFDIVGTLTNTIGVDDECYRVAIATGARIMLADYLDVGAFHLALSDATSPSICQRGDAMIRKLKDGQYRLYSRKINPKTGRRRNLGTFKTRAAAEKHERAVQFFKRAG